MKAWIKRLLPVLAVTLLLVGFSSQLPAALEALASAKGSHLFVVLVGLIIYTACNASVWQDVLAGLGRRVGRGEATSLWVRSEVMKWLPGGIWGYASRVVKAPEIGVARPLAGASLLVELLLTIAAWGTLFLLGLLGSGSQLLGLVTWPEFPVLLGAGVVMGAGGALLWKFRRRVAAIVLARFAPLRDLSWRPLPLVRAFAFYLSLCLFHALLLRVLVLAFRPEASDLAFFASVDGMAWLIGFFAIGVPGGIGVREAGMAWLLSQAMPLPEALAIAISWRVAQLAAEMLVLAGVFLTGPRKRCRTCLDATGVTL